MKKPTEPTSPAAIKFAQVLSEATNVASVELTPAEFNLLAAHRRLNGFGQEMLAELADGFVLDFPAWVARPVRCSFKFGGQK